MFGAIWVSPSLNTEAPEALGSYSRVLLSSVAKTMKAAVKYAAMQQMGFTACCLQDSALHFAAQGP